MSHEGHNRYRALRAQFHWKRSENSQRESRRHRSTSLFTSAQIFWTNRLGSEDRFGRLRMGADDDRLAHLLQSPTIEDAIDLTHGVGAGASCADERRVRSARDAIECSIESAIEKMLHHTG